MAMPVLALWKAVCPWVAIHMFHLSGQRTTYFVTGSGDTTLAYIQNLLIVTVSAAAAPVLMVGGWTAAASVQPRFDPVADTVSELAAQGTPDRWVMAMTFVVVEICPIV